MRASINISKRAKWVLKGTSFVVIPILVSYWLSMFYLHGDALNGYVKDSHYFINWKGAYIEVSKGTWTFSYLHGISAYAGLMLLLIEAAIFVNRKDIDLSVNEDVQTGG